MLNDEGGKWKRKMSSQFQCHNFLSKAEVKIKLEKRVKPKDYSSKLNLYGKQRGQKVLISNISKADHSFGQLW